MYYLTQRKPRGGRTLGLVKSENKKYQVLLVQEPGLENGQGWRFPLLPIPKEVSFIQSDVPMSASSCGCHTQATLSTILQEMKMVSGYLSWFLHLFLHQFTICPGKKEAICWNLSNPNTNDEYVTGLNWENNWGFTFLIQWHLLPQGAINSEWSFWINFFY